MQNEDNYWKKIIVRKRVPNPIPIRVVTFIFEQRKMIIPNEKLNRLK